jgi:hypothetical protein
MDRNFKPLKNKEILEKGVDAEAVLYNENTSAVHIINKTAFQIWKLLDGKHTIDDIENRIKKIFNIPVNSSIFTDIEKTIAEFKVNGLIQ